MTTPERRLSGELRGVRRCPYCGIANPTLPRRWISETPIARADGQPPSRWAVYACTSCGSCILAKGDPADVGVPHSLIKEVIPSPKVAHEDLPPTARTFLQQAYETLHAPDAAAVMAGSAVDSMLKVLGYTDGSLYVRIDKALEDGLLTKGMADWAHHVRLGSNRPRHADEDRPHLTSDEAQQSVAFAEALGTFLFVLTARIDRGIEEAQRAS